MKLQFTEYSCPNFENLRDSLIDVITKAWHCNANQSSVTLILTMFGTTYHIIILKLLLKFQASIFIFD
jgi:hypothetical protein